MSTRVIQQFLETYEKESTRYGYQSALYSYLSVIYNYSRARKRANEKDKENFELLAERYLTEDRNYTEDLILFSKQCDKPTKTIRMYQSVVCEFLRTNTIKKIRFEYPDIKEVKRKVPKRYEVSEDKELSLDVIRIILQHADIKIQTLIYVLLSSGLRISEALSVKLQDYEKIEDGFGKLKLSWQDAKTGRSVFCLVTPECVRVIDEWLKVRNKYISEKCINQSLKFKDDRLFPFSKNVAEVAFRNILDKTGLNSGKNKKNPFHFHQFRGYFISQMNLVVHPEITKYLISGHSRNIDAIYRKYTFRQVIDAYKQASEVLTIGTDPVLRKKYKDTVEELDRVQKNQNLNNEQISTLISQIGLMQNKLEILETKNKMFENIISNLADGKIKLNPNGRFIDIETKS